MGLRHRCEDGVLAYFLRRTGSAELAWELSEETWATVQIAGRRGRAGDDPQAAWVFALARQTLCDSLRAGAVPDRARRKAGVGRCELTEAGVRRVREVATAESLAELVAGLQPALREAVMAPVSARDAAERAARLRERPLPGTDGEPARRRVPRFSRVGLAR